MYENIFSVVSLMCLIFYLYGVLITISVNEKNDCKMTYMFEYPQFVKISSAKDKLYTKYNLYAYSEGQQTENIRNKNFHGAPVIFVPGNKGSYKQVRSLASVALRMAIDQHWQRHLDYFSVDFNEEYSAVFGGFLEEQSMYLAHCIETVLNLYKNLPNRPDSVVIVAHSMGGKIAQSVLLNEKITLKVNTILLLGAPIDKPVLNVDYYIERFYRKIKTFWLDHRQIAVDSEENNQQSDDEIDLIKKGVVTKNNRLLNDLLLITISGGSRDIMVHPGLTMSIFSDINVTSTAIPNVWVTTDHLSCLWCLQQIKVFNRFLFNIIAPTKRYNEGQQFLTNKQQRLLLAEEHLLLPFKKPLDQHNLNTIQLVNHEGNLGDWIENSKRTFSVEFNFGLNVTRFQMIRLINLPQHKRVTIETINLGNNDWLFGCAAVDVNNNMRYCSKAESLKDSIEILPPVNGLKHMTASVDLINLKFLHPTWTHIIIRSLPTRNKLRINYDVYDPVERERTFTMPKWYSYSSNVLVKNTNDYSTFKLNVLGMDDVHQVVELSLKPLGCASGHYSMAKLSLPYIRGYERYHHFENETNEVMAVYVPISKRNRQNSTSPVEIQLFLDPTCSYTISIKNSFGFTMAKIVQYYTPWLLAHFVAVLLLGFKHQISITPSKKQFKCGSVYKGILNSSSYFIITGSRVFAKIIVLITFMPLPDSIDTSLLVSAIVHGAAACILTLFSQLCWFGIQLLGKLLHVISSRTSLLRNQYISSDRFSVIGIGLISLAIATCGTVALLVIIPIYFFLISTWYANYLNDLAASNVSSEVSEGIEPVLETEKLDDQEIVQQFLDKDNSDTELNELIQKLAHNKKEKEAKEIDLKMIEYKQTESGLSDINFHLTMFIFVILLCILNAPTMLAWFKNSQYSQTLSVDPSIVPVVISLFAISILWYLHSIKYFYAEKLITSGYYIMAAFSVIYCQDAIYLLNFIIPIVFSSIALHQIIVYLFLARSTNEN